MALKKTLRVKGAGRKFCFVGPLHREQTPPLCNMCDLATHRRLEWSATNPTRGEHLPTLLRRLDDGGGGITLARPNGNTGHALSCPSFSFSHDKV